MRHDPYMLIQDVEKKLIVGIVGSDTAWLLLERL